MRTHTHWQRIWRSGIAPHLSSAALRALRTALLRDDHRLVQGRTMTPPPLAGLDGAQVEAACAIGWAGWQGDGLATVGELERFFDHICAVADEAVGEPTACRHFLDWFDQTPRPTMRRLLLAEVDESLGRRPLAA
jgi:hypothetical protein